MKTQKLILLIVITCSIFLSCSKDEDKVPPVITILGKNPDSLIVKTVTTYNDPGATANDDQDGDITNKIVKSSLFQPDVIGKWSFYYDVEDNAHNVAEEKQRIVEVVSPTGTYDGTSDCIGSSASTVTISYNSVNDTITISNFYATGTIMKAGLNNHHFEMAPYVLPTNDTITGTFTASGVTLNGSLTIKGPSGTSTCSSAFTRH